MFREKFKVQMWRLLFVVVYTICFSISVSATQQTAIYNVESYSDILDIRCTPYSNVFLILVHGCVLHYLRRITG